MTEPRADDPAALVEEAAAYVKRFNANGVALDPISLIARLADALAAMQETAICAIAAERAANRQLRAAREPLRAHTAHWIEPRDAEPYACCPAHGDYYRLLHSRNAVVEAAGAHVDRPGEDGYRALIDAVMALRAAQDPPR